MFFYGCVTRQVFAGLGSRISLVTKAKGKGSKRHRHFSGSQAISVKLKVWQSFQHDMLHVDLGPTNSNLTAVSSLSTNLLACRIFTLVDKKP